MSDVLAPTRAFVGIVAAEHSFALENDAGDTVFGKGCVGSPGNAEEVGGRITNGTAAAGGERNALVVANE